MNKVAYDRTIMVPSSLSLDKLAPWTESLFQGASVRRTLFDATNVGYCPPFGALLLSASVRRYRALVRKRFPDYLPINFTPNPPTVDVHPALSNSFCSHIALWQAMGVPSGKSVGQAPGGSRYLPITSLSRQQLDQARSVKSQELGDAIDAVAERAANVLSQQDDTIMSITLTYCIRELIRNIFEHSTANTAWYCAQYWPSKDLVEFAVLDEGCGILEALSPQVEVNPFTEARAIGLATQRGVTGAKPKIKLNSMWAETSDDRWSNAGWGLFILKELCRVSGAGLTVLSNTCYTTFSTENERTVNANHKGTAVRVQLKPSKLSSGSDGVLQRILKDSLKDIPPEDMTASMRARISNSV